MECCSIGLHLPGVEFVQLASTRTLLDFACVFIDPTGISSTSDAHYLRRKRDLSELLGRGGAVIWFLRSGDLQKLLPANISPAVGYSGTKVNVIGAPVFRQFWDSVGKEFSYEAVIEGTSGTPVAVVPGTERVIASWLRFGPGVILLLPCLKISGTLSAVEATQKKVIAAVEVLLARLQPSHAELTLPSWALRYSWDREAQLRREILSLQKTAEEMRRAISVKSADLAAEERLKLLMSGTGGALVDVVRTAFEELGATVETGEPGRDDLIVTYEGQTAVVEVKGKKGSAAEKDAAQLEKWVAGFMEAKDVRPKGMLIVNAYCDEPLAARKAAAFPDQMLKYSTQREHCLVTTAQLLGALLAFRRKQAEGVELLNSLFTAVGIYPQFSDYREFLTET
jgi:hypothetical protein